MPWVALYAVTLCAVVTTATCIFVVIATMRDKD